MSNVTGKQFSMGLWGVQNLGADPFGSAVRQKISPKEALDLVVESGASIKNVSFHDGDLWEDGTEWEKIEDTVSEIKEYTKKIGLKVFNFTCNLFSSPCFRSGAFSSPFPEVVEAAIIKATQAIDVANLFGAENFIWWGGREGTDGAYEQDPGLALKKYMLGIRTCLKYGLAQGYTFKHSIEPKQYEPRLLALYAGSGASAASAIKTFFPEEDLPWIKINPEYPQHTMMLGADPVVELGQLLVEDMLANFIHIGGQIGSRMDCDLPPGWGGNYLTDFFLCLTLIRHKWDGIIEFDCRPARTTVSRDGIKRFLKNATGYWRNLEDIVEEYQDTEKLVLIEKALNRPQSDNLKAVFKAVEESNKAGLIDAVGQLRSRFLSFNKVAKVDTDMIEEYQEQVKRMILGYDSE